MINRNRTASQYVFNSETGALEKLEDITTAAQAAIEKTTEELNPNTSIVVITAEDNLIHNYFYSYETSWDASSCLQIAKIKMPKMGNDNVNYWAKYVGQLTIYVGYNFVFDHVNSNSHATEQSAAASLVKYWDNSKIKPFFRGEVDKIKEYQNDVTIYVKNIGGRFQQKIPEDFRQSYINNQNVRDAFQAICEFLGIQYICPPRTVTDSEGEEEVENDTGADGTENNVGEQVSNANKLATAAKNKVKKKTSTKTSSTKKKTSSSTKKSNSKTTNTSNITNAGTTNNSDSDSDNSADEENEDVSLEEEEVSDIMNGYDDINFDANGFITHSSAVIETSPDVAHTLTAMEEHPFERYLDDETGIAEKVNKFLNGDMFDELHNNVMDYGAITIEPKSGTTSEMSTVSDSSAISDTQNNQNNNQSNNSSSSSSSRASSSKTTGAKGVWGKTAKGSYYLTQDAINKMSMAEAKRRYEDGKKRNIYTAATMQKLWYRMMFGTKFF